MALPERCKPSNVCRRVCLGKVRTLDEIGQFKVDLYGGLECHWASAGGVGDGADEVGLLELQSHGQDCRYWGQWP